MSLIAPPLGGEAMAMFVHARALRRHHGHQHRRRIQRAPARHVHSDAFDRRVAHAELAATAHERQRVAMADVRLIGADVVDHAPHQRKERRVGGAMRALDLGLRHADRVLCNRRSVELVGERGGRAVAAVAHAREDIGDDARYVEVLFLGARDQTTAA